MNFSLPFSGCQKEFNRPDKLKSHILTHSGIKPYKCRECGRSFGRKPHLREHERGHRADFKFKCEICGKGYFRPKLFNDHKCHPLKPGQAHVFRPRNKRKVGRPKKRLPAESEGIRVENTMTLMHEKEAKPTNRADTAIGMQNVIVQEENGENEGVDVNGQMAVGINEEEQEGDQLLTTSMSDKRASHISDRNSLLSGKKFEFCVKVSAPPPPPPATVTPRYVTVHIQNSNTPTGQEIQTHLLPHPSQQLLPHTAGATMQPITIIEAQHMPMHLPMMTGLDGGAGDAAIAMQMATINGASAESLAQSVAAVGGVVSELIPVAVMQEHPDSLVATQVVVTSAGANDHGYITCPTHLEDYGASDGDLVLQNTDNFLKTHTDIYQSSQQ